MSHSRNDADDSSDVETNSHADLSRMLRQGRSFSGLERNCSFLNLGSTPTQGKEFATVSSVTGLDFPDDGRTAIQVDWDFDGDQDLWLTSRNAPRMRLMRNESTSKNHFVALRLRGNGTTTNRDAIGARIALFTEQNVEAPQIKTLRAGGSFLSQGSKVVSFGLGETQKIINAEVSWPGGTTETFTGLTMDRQHELIQGTGLAKMVTPAITQSVLTAATQRVPRSTRTVRIPLMTPLPKPIISYLDNQEEPQELRIGLGQPILLTLWLSSCPNCQKELKEFTRRAADLRSKGIGVLALSVDTLNDPKDGRLEAEKLLNKIKFPFPTGYATEKLVQELQDLNNLVLPLEETLPVPASFLFDDAGRLTVIYKGLAEVDQLLADLAPTPENQSERLQRAAPIKGSSIQHPIVDAASIESRARTLFYMGTVMSDSDRYEDAISYYKEVLKLKPTSFKAHYNLGIAYQQRRLLQPALSHLETAVRLNSDSLLALEAYGNLLFSSGHSEKAQKTFNKLLRLDQQHQGALLNLAILAASNSDYAEAKDYFQKAAVLNPDSAQLQYNWGATLLSNGQRDEATERFNAALKIDANYPDANHYLGLIAEENNNLDLAAGYYLQELKINARSPKTLNQLGLIMERSNRTEDALKLYVQSLRVDPEFAPARANYERLRAVKADSP